MWRGLNFDVCLKYCSYRQNYFSLQLVDNAVPTIFSFTFEKKKRECTEKRNVIPIKQENCIHKPPEFYHLVYHFIIYQFIIYLLSSSSKERSILKWVWDQPFVINHSEWFHSPERSFFIKELFLYIFFAYKANVLYSGVPMFKTKRNTQEELIQNINRTRFVCEMWTFI